MRLTYDDLVDFQQEGVAFLLDSPAELNYKNHRYLAFDPGLGKTPTACVAASMLKPRGLGTGGRLKALWIVPTGTSGTVKRQWAKELVTWGVCDESEIFIVPDRSSFTNANHIIVNPELLVTSPPLLHALLQLEFDLVAYDESHGLKNMDAKITNLVLGKKGEGLISRGWSRWLFSGSPAPNAIIELFPVYKALAPECIAPYTSRESFGRYFCGGYFDGKEFKARGLTNGPELAARSQCFILRREIRDVHKDLPSVIETDVWLDIGDLPISQKNAPTATVRRFIGEAKVHHCTDYIVDWLEANGGLRAPKLLVFGYHPDVIDALALSLSKYGAARIHGKCTDGERKLALNAFLNNDSCRTLIAQMGCMGTAINGLQKVCYNIVFAENDWSDGGNHQQIGRVWRFGQEHIVYVANLIADKTMDSDGIIRSRWRKREVITEFNSYLKEVEQMSILEDILEQLERIGDAMEAQNAHDGVAQIVNATGNGQKSPRKSKAQKDAEAAAIAGAPGQFVVPQLAAQWTPPKLPPAISPPFVAPGLPAGYVPAPTAAAPGIPTLPAVHVGVAGLPAAAPTAPPIPQASTETTQPDIPGFPTLEQLSAVAVDSLQRQGGSVEAKNVIAQIVGQHVGKPTAALKEVPAQVRPQLMGVLQQWAASAQQPAAAGM